MGGAIPNTKQEICMLDRKNHFLLTIPCLLVLILIVFIQNAEARGRGLPGAVLSIGDGKEKDPLFKT